jgi:hypothetical protein
MFGRANPRAYGAQRIVQTDGLGRAFDVFETDGTDEFRGIGAGRTHLGARRVQAQKATGGFLHCQKGRKSHILFFEMCFTHM